MHEPDPEEALANRKTSGWMENVPKFLEAFRVTFCLRTP